MGNKMYEVKQDMMNRLKPTNQIRTTYGKGKRNDNNKKDNLLSDGGKEKKARMHRPLQMRDLGKEDMQIMNKNEKRMPRKIVGSERLSKISNIDRKDRISTQKERKRNKISARSVLDSLEGESHQPRYVPHHSPSPPHPHYGTHARQVGDNGLQASVIAGAAGYNAEGYKEPQRLSFQIHGQEGPHSYRFGHDTGLG